MKVKSPTPRTWLAAVLREQCSSGTAVLPAHRGAGAPALPTAPLALTWVCPPGLRAPEGVQELLWALLLVALVVFDLLKPLVVFDLLKLQLRDGFARSSQPLLSKEQKFSSLLASEA